MREIDLKKLLKSLSWKEKIGQLIQLPGEFFDTSSLTLGPQEKLGISDEILENVGSVLNVAGAKRVNKIQKKYLEQSRHKIPLLFMADIIYGYHTIFPIPLGLGSTWNPELLEKAYTVIGQEAQAAGVQVTFSPMMDLVRDARWGRVLETTGEDVLLNSVYARAMVEGLQKGLIHGQGVASCVKHFAGYGAVESGREYNTVDMSERTLRQHYLPAYQAAIEAGSKMVMTSFNTYDGVPATANEFLLKSVLREEWGFEGVVISDYASVKELVDHGVAKNNKEAAKLSISASTDIDMKSPCYANELENLIIDGEIDEDLVDQAVWRVLKLKNELGLFENPNRGASPEREKHQILQAEHRLLAKQVAEEAIVLLSNKNQVLPLKRGEEKILLVGPYGDSQELIGLWAVHGKKEEVVSIKTGIEQCVDDSMFHFEKCCEISTDFRLTEDLLENKKSLTDLDLERVKHLAEEADVIIYALGEHTLQSGEGGSRTDIRLPQIQRELMEELSSLKKKNILISISGRPLNLTREVEMMDAILQVWFPGIEGGNAIADILFGKVNPSGRLSMSFPRNVGQVPIYYNEFKTGRPQGTASHSERFVTGYIDSLNTPLFPFGFGLSYSEVEYSKMKLESSYMKDHLKVEILLENKSPYPCKETVQLYVQDVVGSVVRPTKELKQFKKIKLDPYEKRTVSFELTREELKYFTKDMVFDVEPGDFVVYVGPNSRDILQGKFVLL